MQEEQESGAIIVVFTELESNDDLPHEVPVSKRCTITTEYSIWLHLQDCIPIQASNHLYVTLTHSLPPLQASLPSFLLPKLTTSSPHPFPSTFRSNFHPFQTPPHKSPSQLKAKHSALLPPHLAPNPQPIPFHSIPLKPIQQKNRKTPTNLPYSTLHYITFTLHLHTKVPSTPYAHQPPRAETAPSLIFFNQIESSRVESSPVQLSTNPIQSYPNPPDPTSLSPFILKHTPLSILPPLPPSSPSLSRVFLCTSCLHSIHPFIHPFIRLSNYSIHLFIRLSIHLSISSMHAQTPFFYSSKSNTYIHSTHSPR